MDMFKMIKEAAAMKSKLSQMEKDLKNRIIDVETKGVKIKINAKAEILEIKLPQEILKQDVERTEKDILAALQQASKKSHEIMMEEAKKITGGMNIPGLM
ncbi:MAG: hypothetical protein A2293_15745 [Elusimicrobia bacterium RIFOXYB2_FULL_49_7]|nr:MAG: hypothetical protein A2293_15745 [Elusimicrobia bacterium RIFOXYB2_FULL_49_7]